MLVALVCAAAPPLIEIVTLLTVPLVVVGAAGSVLAVVVLRSGRVRQGPGPADGAVGGQRVTGGRGVPA